MIWWLVILGMFVAIAAAMYVPDWVRWARWNRRRKQTSPGTRLRPPVAAPFWSSYSGHAPDAGGADGGSCYGGGGLGGGGGDGGGCD